jgi:hypothetical protein
LQADVVPQALRMRSESLATHQRSFVSDPILHSIQRQHLQAEHFNTNDILACLAKPVT